MKQINKGVAIVVASLLAGGAVAAETKVAKKQITQREQSQARATKKNEKLAKKRVAQRKANAALATQQRHDAISSSSSSATSAATVAPAMTAGTSAAPLGKVSKRPSFVDNIRASVLFEYYGASVTEPFSGYQTDKANGYSQGTDPVSLETRATLGYKLSPNLTLAANAYFWMHGTSYDPDTGMNKGDAESFVFKPAASFLQLSVGKFLQAGNFKWNGDFRFYPGLGKAGEGLPVYLRSGQNFFYPLSPKWTLAAYNTIRYYHRTAAVYENDTKNTRVDFRATIGPAIEYQLADTLGLSLSFNKDFRRIHNTGKIGDAATLLNDPTLGQYFELGASWDITKRINLNPYADMYTATPNIEAVQMGANLNISIL